MFDLVAPPAQGRSFEGTAVVRLGDSSPGGRARLDAIARFLQDISDDDAREAGFGTYSWVVRRTVISVQQFPVYLESLRLRTWCAGFGAAWAERRISVEGGRGGRLESATLWVNVDPSSRRPARLPADFLAVFGPSAAGRTVPSRLLLPAAPTADAGTPWPLRFTDFDVLEHVNNAVYFAPVEQALAIRRHLRAPMTVVVEHGDPIERDDQPRWIERDRDDGDGLDGWLVADGRQFAAVSVVAGATAPGSAGADSAGAGTTNTCSR